MLSSRNKETRITCAEDLTVNEAAAETKQPPPHSDPKLPFSLWTDLLKCSTLRHVFEAAPSP